MSHRRQHSKEARGLALKVERMRRVLAIVERELELHAKGCGRCSADPDDPCDYALDLVRPWLDLVSAYEKALAALESAAPTA